MRIGVDAREFKKGVYTGLRTILEDLFFAATDNTGHELVLFCDRETDLGSLPDKAEKVVLAGPHTLYIDQVALPVEIKRREIDVFFSPFVKTPFLRVCPYVNTVADIIPFVIPKRKGVKGLLERLHFFVLGLLCARRAVKVVTLSGDAGEKAAKLFFLDRGKIKVAYPAVIVPSAGEKDAERESDLSLRYGLNEPYLLYVGNYKPHKNLDNLISAYGLLPKDIKEGCRLLLVGGSEGETRSMHNVLEQKKLTGKIVPVGNIRHTDIFTFMKFASIFVFPSLEEGFGIPPVEAMAMGIPVASSRLAPMTEVLGDAAEYFDPHDPKDIARAITELLKNEDVRKRCVEKGRRRAGFFSSGAMTRSIMEALEDAGRVKTLMVTSEFPPVKGGMSTMLFNLWKRLPSGRIAVLTGGAVPKGYPYDKGLDIVRKTYPLGSDSVSRMIRVGAVVWHMFRQNSVRKIRHNHCAQVISSGLGGYLLKKLKGTPYTVYLYSADILEFSKGRVTRRVMADVIRESDRVIVCSDFAATLLEERKLAWKDKVIVLTPGVDTERFSPQKGAGEIRRRYGIGESSRVLLTVSRLAARKGHDAVLKALPGILEVFPDTVYIIAGDGPERQRLERISSEGGLGDHVIFAGEVNSKDLVHFYNACDIFVLIPRIIVATGDAEGFGIVFLEAGACGKPVVGGRSGGVTEAVKDGITGILVDPEDVTAIRAALLKLLGDRAYAAQLGANGIRVMREEFSWERRSEILGRYI